MGIIIPEGASNVTFLISNMVNNKLYTTGFGVVDIDLSPRTAAEIAELMDEMVTTLNYPFHAASMVDGYQYKGTSVTQTVDGEPVVSEFSHDVNGSGSSEAAPPNCALLIRKVTAAGGRHNRGRMYLPPCNFGENDLDVAGNLDSTQQTTLQTEWTATYDGTVAADLVPTLFHSDETAATPIQAFSVESLIATQRRRLR